MSKYICILFCFAISIVQNYAFSQDFPNIWKFEKSSLPKCLGKNKNEWTACYGASASPSGLMYRGEFRDGKYSGKGAIYFSEGGRYIGNFENDKYEGFGIFHYSNGDTYFGNWLSGYRHGLGIYESAQDSLSREGIWKNDKFIEERRVGSVNIDISDYELINGVQNVEKLPGCPIVKVGKRLDQDRLALFKKCWGFYKFKNLTERKGDYYEGEWLDGLPNGNGVYFLSNGDRYEGILKNGKQHGEGFYSYSKGGYYSGGWLDGKYDGVGNSVYQNGDWYFGEHKNGLRHGSGQYTSFSGKISEGIWENGRLTKKLDVISALIKAEKNEHEGKTAAKKSSKLKLEAEASIADQNGQLEILIKTNADTSSLKINGEEQGGRSDGIYKIKKVARIGQDTQFVIIAVDINGNSDSKTITVSKQMAAVFEPNIAVLKPESIRRSAARDAVAIIIGIQDYKRVPKADFANNDAKEFYEYAVRALGVKPEKIKILLDGEADDVNIIKAFENWLPLQVSKDKTDVYVFFSGHGLPSNDGKSLYFLPHTVDKDLLSRTAVAQSEMVAALVAARPKSVTMFIDACYSGQTKNGDVLLANARPLALKAESSSYPTNFTVITASANDQISSSSQDLKHGIFSFYLMKGMEGEADTNNDRKITIAEMQEYLADKVGRQAMALNRRQTPQLFGDSARVLVEKK